MKDKGTVNLTTISSELSLNRGSVGAMLHYSIKNDEKIFSKVAPGQYVLNSNAPTQDETTEVEARDESLSERNIQGHA